MATVTIMDPVTRIEGHLKVQVTVDQGKVASARCTGTMFRGFEQILVGRDPWDASVLTQRICGVCPISHGVASVLALEQTASKLPNTNGRLLRNLTLGANFVQSHILHFYLLAMLDYVPGPQTAPWTPMWEIDMRPGLSSVASHLPQALQARRRAHEMGAVFAGRMPTAHSIIPGGDTAMPTTDRIRQYREHLNWLTTFIRDVYIPDVLAVAEAYEDYQQIGKGCRNLLAYGVFEEDNDGTRKLLRPGWAAAANLTQIQSLNTSSIKESVLCSWYSNTTNALNPASGKTVPQYPKRGAYSWLKAPRYEKKPMETGALARMWLNGDYRQGISVMDRHLARALEALKVAEAMQTWLNQLQVGQRAHSSFNTPSGTASGLGLTEAPRGALGHWVRLSGGRIANYQIITPTCWNASPRDGSGVPGPIEQALIGTPITDAARPVEALRVIHSFDPCLSCAVHVMRPSGEVTVVHTPRGR